MDFVVAALQIQCQEEALEADKAGNLSSCSFSLPLAHESSYTSSAISALARFCVQQLRCKTLLHTAHRYKV